MVKVNLPANSYGLTQEDRSKGGKTESVYRTLGKSLAMRKKCNPRCPFFESCPTAAMSMDYKDPKDPSKNGACLMKEFPLTVRQQFVNMFLSGEEGVIRAIKDAFHLYMMEVTNRGTLRDQRDMIALLIQFYEKCYVEPSKKNGLAGREPLQINIVRVSGARETITIQPKEPLPEGTTMKDLLHPRNGDETEGDPESLINSPIIDRIVDPRRLLE
jgi:hypothetical protein